MIQELIDYHKTKMCLAGAEGRVEDFKLHKAAIELFEKISLPYNLDEAADKYVQTLCDRADDNLRIDTTLQAAFKAGAEWMAGQGYTTETTVHRTPLNGPAGICLNLHDSTGFKIGDKVIVQIRKK